MRHIFFCTFLTAIGVMILACGQPAAKTYDDSPTGAYKRLFDAVKSKNTDAIRAVMSKKTLETANMMSAQWKRPLETVLENGMEESTFSPTLPQIRDERVKGDAGAVEVYNAKQKGWEDVPFIREDGVWKLAIGDMMAGSYELPGESESQKEQEAANAVTNNMIPLNANTNVNTNTIKPIVPKPASNMMNGNVTRPAPNK
ncbi:MAG TPA: hypothetical protein VGJ02_04145 [Pyrinomonadaceae bacterium]